MAGFLSVRHVNKHFGSHHALRDVSFEVARGEVTTLLGPSGCGKTTMLRSIAGLETIDGGAVELDGRLLDDGGRAHVPPERRGIGMVFQSYALWPHMTVGDNIALGLRLKRLDAATVSRKVTAVLAIVGLAGMEGRFPSALSGGQQQRVSLARALALEPTCLLFDEPLSNLDLMLRERMRFEIREILVRAGITAIYVTHDQSEAMVISDRLLVMDRGQVVQQGSPAEVYRRPATRFVSEFLGGSNLLPLSPVGSDAAIGHYSGPDGIHLRGIPETSLPPDGLIAFRPEDVAIARGDEPSNIMEAVVTTSTFLGACTQCELMVGATRVNASLPGFRPMVPGEARRFWIDPNFVSIVADGTGIMS